MEHKGLNPCKCGTDRKPHIDSDDMVPCWAAECFNCGQFVHGPNWTFREAVEEWNKNNPIKKSKDKENATN